MFSREGQPRRYYANAKQDKCGNDSSRRKLPQRTFEEEGSREVPHIMGLSLLALVLNEGTVP